MRASLTMPFSGLWHLRDRGLEPNIGNSAIGSGAMCLERIWEWLIFRFLTRVAESAFRPLVTSPPLKRLADDISQC